MIGLVATTACAVTTISSAPHASAAPHGSASNAAALNAIALNAIAPAAYTAAVRDASRTGRAEVISSTMTDTSEVIAEPNGQFDLQSAAAPVRTRSGGQWHAINTTLVVRDGMVLPTSTGMRTQFSEGGEGPAVTVGDPGREVRLFFPVRLPTPSLHGATATYTNVLPGVSLLLTATAMGYQLVLKVLTRRAARNPAVRHISLRTTSSALTIRSGQSHMWDSSSNTAEGPAPTATDPGSARLSDVRHTVAPSRGPISVITVSPPEAVLDSAATKYPVYIDADLHTTKNQTLTVTSNNSNNHYGGTSNLLVGLCDWNCSGKYVARSFVALDMSHLATGEPIVTNASVTVNQVWNASSAATPVNLVGSRSFGAGNDHWPGTAVTATLGTQSHNYGHAAHSGRTYSFTTSALTAYVKSAVTARQKTLYLGLKSPDEHNRYDWKQFANAPGPGATPVATVSFHYPSTPPVPPTTGAPMTPVEQALPSDVWACRGTTYLNPTAAALEAKSAVGGGGATSPSLGISFQLNRTSPATPAEANATVAPVPTTSGTYAIWDGVTNATDSAPLADGVWQFRSRATVGAKTATQQSSAWSGYQSFSVDSSAPDVPIIARVAGTGDQFTVTDDSSDVAGFLWAANSGGEPALTGSVDGPSSCPTASSTSGSNGNIVLSGTTRTATITVPTIVGSTPFYVDAYDGAGNVSAEVGLTPDQ